MGKIYKCRYGKHCKHESVELAEGEGVLYGKCHWHKDCLDESLAIREIIDIFQEKINPNVVFSSLRRVINNIVYNQNIDAEMLLFGVNYYIENNIKINYPMGLYYVIQNKEVQKAWANRSSKIDMHSFTVSDENNTRKYNFKGEKEKDITNILC